MADQRPLVLINGHLRQLPVGDDLSTHKALIQVAGEYRQLPDGTDYSLHSPLIYLNLEIVELPAGDTLIGIPVSGSYNFSVERSYVHLVLRKKDLLFKDSKIHLILEPI